MQVSDVERNAVKQVIAAGEQYGFGNMISHLATAWARSLMSKWGMSEKNARAAAWGLSGYPFKMQDDILQNGKWDETGKSYE